MKRFLGKSSSSSSKTPQNESVPLPLEFMPHSYPQTIEEEEEEQQTVVGSQTSTYTKKTNRGKSSKVWNYFDVVDEKAICKLCKAKFSFRSNSGTGTLTRHLNNHHKNWEDNDLLDNSRQQNLDVSSSGTITNYAYKQDEVRIELAKMVIGAELPFNFVENHYFSNFIKKAQPRFKNISRNTCYKDGYKIYEYEIIALKTLFSKITSKISLTTDLWLGRQGLHYLCVTAHWINENFMLEKRIIEFSLLEHPHDGLSIYQAIMSCLNYWEISDKIMSITLDNASNNSRAIELLQEFLKPNFDAQFFHIRCVCHILHLCVCDGMQSVRPHIDLIRDCLLFITSSSVRLQKYRRMVKSAKMKFKIPYIDVKTRWSSTYRMLMEAKPYSSIIIRYIKEESNSRISFISETDWEIIDILIPLLQIFNDMTNTMSGCYYPTSNIMLREMVDIVKIFDEHRYKENVKEIIEKMETKWKKYYESVPFCAIFAYIFDPRCKKDGCEVYLEEYYSCLGIENPITNEQLEDFLNILVSSYTSSFKNTVTTTMSSSANKSTGSSSSYALLDKIKKRKNDTSTRSTNELKHYLSLDLVEHSEDFDILHWWKMEQKNYPILSIIARDLLTCQMSSVASESAFSAGARTVTDRRTRLTPKSIKFCMLLKNWLDEEYRMNNLKRLEIYKMREMKEEDQEDEDGEPDVVINAQDDEEPDVERFYFPTTDYYYSSTQDPNFTYDWQNYPD